MCYTDAPDDEDIADLDPRWAEEGQVRCRHFNAKHRCIHGNKCNFAHVNPTLGKDLLTEKYEANAKFDPNQVRYHEIKDKIPLRGFPWYNAAYVDPDTNTIYYAEDFDTKQRDTLRKGLHFFQSKEEACSAVERVFQIAKAEENHRLAKLEPKDSCINWADDGKRRCKYFAMDHWCKNGVSCPYAHVCPPLKASLKDTDGVAVNNLDTKKIEYREQKDSEGFTWFTAAYTALSGIIYYAEDKRERNEQLYYFLTKAAAKSALERVVSTANKAIFLPAKRAKCNNTSVDDRSDEKNIEKKPPNIRKELPKGNKLPGNLDPNFGMKWAEDGRERCRFFCNGQFCRNGHNCRYAHVCPPIGITLKEPYQRYSGHFHRSNIRSKKVTCDKGLTWYTGAYIDPETKIIYYSETHIPSYNRNGVALYASKEVLEIELKRVYFHAKMRESHNNFQIPFNKRGVMFNVDY